MKTKKPRFLQHGFFNKSYYSKKMAGAEGFEPPITGPKPVALPLGHAPKTKM